MHLSRSRPFAMAEARTRGAPRVSTSVPFALDTYSGVSGPGQGREGRTQPAWPAVGGARVREPHLALPTRSAEWETWAGVRGGVGGQAGTSWAAAATWAHASCRAWGALFRPRGAGADPGRLRGPRLCPAPTLRGSAVPIAHHAVFGAHSGFSRPRLGHGEAGGGSAHGALHAHVAPHTGHTQRGPVPSAPGVPAPGGRGLARVGGAERVAVGRQPRERGRQPPGARAQGPGARDGRGELGLQLAEVLVKTTRSPLGLTFRSTVNVPAGSKWSSNKIRKYF